MKPNKTYIKVLVISSLLAIGLSFIQLPYYVTKPGLATELKPLVEVEGGFDDEEGSFMLTTVRMGRANIFSYAWAYLNKYNMIYPMEQIRNEGESDDEYTYRQLYLMEGSKEAAIAVAYQHADKPVSFTYQGVYVMGVLEGMPAFEQLQAGDRIYMADGKEFNTSDEFIEIVSGKKQGEEVDLMFERNGQKETVRVQITPFPTDPTKVGVGISLVTDREITVEPDITINSEKIGGPSAGLMFSLEVYNQLTEGDLTKGFEIAGTGTINDKGVVGRIGGISQKIVAADNTGVEIFLAPNEMGNTTSNYQEALATAKEIGTDMEIVPINTFEDALEYLNNLQPKK
ncbi:SepM family pheromone-processing serine protease [Cytobacillus sp. S13-E01]|uniref:SepM family pheromone-processing serine protease n=1 Tax=Cytobacillus sp. S13-E01 TaxID=3031326 RepID=UPI0023D7F77A|nr:SepM family pheromone-processing serine protease [Cytobacillus sp. S13-E01]MDF0725300.1 SepM family pheromone-processing serine protease [Cytobacillus sp. S13-E01]